MATRVWRTCRHTCVRVTRVRLVIGARGGIQIACIHGFDRTSELHGAARRDMNAGERVWIQGDGVALEGSLTVPSAARGVVVFAHGSGSSRHSPRNVRVAKALVERGFGTLLFDLLLPAEDM